MAHVTMYLTATCPYCQSAERLLAEKGATDVETTSPTRWVPRSDTACRIEVQRWPRP